MLSLALVVFALAILGAASILLGGLNRVALGCARKEVFARCYRYGRDEPMHVSIHCFRCGRRLYDVRVGVAFTWIDLDVCKCELKPCSRKS